MEGFDAAMKWHLIEEFGPESFRVQDDGTLLFEHEYIDKDSLITWMLSCRDKVMVLEPESVREELLQITSEIAKRYVISKWRKHIGSSKPFLMEGYNWKTYGAMNIVFYNRCQNISEEEAYKSSRNLTERLWRHWKHFHRKSCLLIPITRGSAEAALEVILSAQRAVIMIGR